MYNGHIWPPDMINGPKLLGIGPQSVYIHLTYIAYMCDTLDSGGGSTFHIRVLYSSFTRDLIFTLGALERPQRALEWYGIVLG